MALGEIARQDLSLARSLAERMGSAIAQEATAIGINWLLAPVVDINNNPANPVINVRAFGDTAQTVAELASAFITGAKKSPVLTSAKHFPGHGDTDIDSHLHLPVLSHSFERLQRLELEPFERAIAAIGNAVHEGRIAPDAILRSVERIWRAKHMISAPLIPGQNLVLVDDVLRCPSAKYAQSNSHAHNRVARIDINYLARNPARQIAT